MFTMIAAADRHGLIGSYNRLPWPHNKEDMQHFKRVTKGRIAVMGSKTFESVLDVLHGQLPDCVNMVMTSKPKRYDTDVYVRDEQYYPMEDRTFDLKGLLVTTREEFLEKTKDKHSVVYKSPEEFIICGGAQTYSWFLRNKLINRIYLTRIHGEYSGDSWLPWQDIGVEWQVVKDWKIKDGHIFELHNVGYNPGLYIDWTQLGFTNSVHKQAVGFDFEALQNLTPIAVPIKD